LRVAGTGNGATLAVKTWTNPRALAPSVPYGDTATDTVRVQRWRAAADYRGIDTLVKAAGLPWRLAAALASLPDTSRGILSRTINPYAPMTTTRAMLARADAVDPLDSLLYISRAVITIGRALQSDLSLVHIVTGLRIERDGLAFLVRRGLADSQALAGVERALATGLRGLHLIRIAGAMPTHAATLAQAASDATLPLAARREALLSIGYGWAFNAQESGSLNRRPERKDALENLKASSLPPALRPALAAAQEGAAFGVSTRVFIGPDYQTLTAALRMAW
jgi:hypothetical protein